MTKQEYQAELYGQIEDKEFWELLTLCDAADIQVDYMDTKYDLISLLINKQMQSDFN